MSDPSTKKPAQRKFWFLVFITILLVLAGWGIVSRIHAASVLRQQTKEQSVPTVTTMQAAAGPASEEIVLHGNVQVWHEAPIYARTNGYIKDWKTHIGAH